MDDHLCLLERCELCPRRCRVNRLGGQTGYCGVTDRILIAYYGRHYGEEPPISGDMGSGNIFFSSCNLRCIYCQNYQISHTITGREFSIEELAGIFLELERQGCHNINLVSPIPYIPMIIPAIEKARSKGLKLPFVYNTNAYENVETIRLLEGFIDIYLPDFKYWNKNIAKRLSDVGDYPEHAQAAILEMKAQVGDLVVKKGIAEKGLLLRHLVLPNNLAGSRQILAWVLKELGRDTYLSLMSQYYPLHNASQYPMINRRIKDREYDELIDFLITNGFENVFIQEPESAEEFIPDFRLRDPFSAITK
ncbi:MAG TPA: radical SAM protein [Syntrophorhabdaceae bacterium]|nr:radical SAM protein [Syntrophorhabdaceae bacterium]